MGPGTTLCIVVTGGHTPVTDGAEQGGRRDDRSACPRANTRVGGGGIRAGSGGGGGVSGRAGVKRLAIRGKAANAENSWR